MTTASTTEVEGSDASTTICAMLTSSPGTILRDIEFSFELTPDTAGQCTATVYVACECRYIQFITHRHQ